MQTVSVLFVHLSSRCMPFDWRTIGARSLAMVAGLALGGLSTSVPAQVPEPIAERNMSAQRDSATGFPRSEDDQAVVGQWPVYRTRRGQEAFNAAMATLAATRGPAPRSDALARCVDLRCDFNLPELDRSGWLPAGRLWVAPTRYVLIVRSPREDEFSRRDRSAMRYFVFHEFHNSTHNTDVFDTISAHSGSVFVPFYLGKTGVDAQGYNYVALVQVAPFDVYSNHAANYGSAGPGVEVAKNANDELEPLQRDAGIVLARMIKARAAHLEVVNHRGTEGLAMLRAYEAHLRNAGQSTSRSDRITLPFVPASEAQRTAAKVTTIAELIHRRDMGPPPAIAVAERSFLPEDMRRVRRVSNALAVARVETVPQLLGPMLPAPRPAARPQGGVH